MKFRQTSTEAATTIEADSLKPHEEQMKCGTALTCVSGERTLTQLLSPTTAAAGPRALTGNAHSLAMSEPLSRSQSQLCGFSVTVSLSESGGLSKPLRSRAV